ncbi:M20 family peptidase [Clostridium perfringens]|uniref:Peptidase M20 domain-containing protein 2 n=1 Tax=Clostridium perfringens (strain ATCC 13124 / DSM 756 / JCM 1290 / NCIMB 6125 / NCTC 8237 / Type A) TaxID=195103 RepID=A0A0H2YP61_CLOP1|nr:amidohydrolase [Clostridium perfringens]ABG82554.1 amidohydrolase homolog [Clostridium perfringens ATCC 13124]ALG50048.1 Catalyzes the cleavage of p-aminobenzoyl-glutamate to p-aminobenzoate and glutamate, subunit A [Clostridium perfringens]EHK2389630.1 M20 family peptidase [Clostridium perfringens]EHK2404848.1 M20 family peptidase [Clostridium perfringens]EJT5934534.1 M20 family peptidase [Clostridium perfringens]
MRQEVISYLSTEKEALFNLCKFLHDNPEDSYKEYDACKYICNFLRDRDFDVREKFLDLDTAFYAKKGNGYPKICFLCEYDAIKSKGGHITGHNLLTTISITSALGLSKVIEKSGGTVILIGCPGEYLGGTKSTYVRQGIFDDIDVVLTAHPDIVTSESGTSKAIIPLKVTFKGHDGLSFLDFDSFTSLDGTMLTFNVINALSKGFCKKANIHTILSQGGVTPLLRPVESEGKLYIRAESTKTAKCIENKIRNIVACISDTMNLESCVELYEPPNEELLSNQVLNRLYSHNLKENGIINIGKPRDIDAGLSLGTVSHKVPCIHPYINIVDNVNIDYGTKEFADATISSFAQEQALSASYALISTALDLIESDFLLSEVKETFNMSKENLY